jgi:hypothetical protein
MQIYIKEANEIYSSKTKKYFKEVISSYENENYRSAIVMLYSVVVCDILFKLQELVDKYDDSGAKNILENFKKNSKDSNKSKWESKLLEDVNNRTELIDEITFEQLKQLKVYRNWAAHPILNENFDLSEPSKETVISFILVMLNKILIKPSIFIKNIFSSLVEDLSENEEIYINNYGGLENYLERKYFCRMPQSMKNKVFKSLWKITFNLPEDELCKKNQKINMMALKALVSNCQIDIGKFIESDNSVFSVSNDELCRLYLVEFLSNFPSIYPILDKSVKDKIINLNLNNIDSKALSWFIEGDLIKHLEVVKKDCASMDKESADFIYKYYKNNGLKAQIIDAFIYIFSQSSSYDMSNIRYDKYIHPYLNKMNCEQLINLIEAINKNSQIYSRRNHIFTCLEVYNVAKEKLQDGFSFDDYVNFYVCETERNTKEDNISKNIEI